VASVVGNEKSNKLLDDAVGSVAVESDKSVVNEGVRVVVGSSDVATGLVTDEEDKVEAEVVSVAALNVSGLVFLVV
jgi:hypothetical protein